MPTKNLRVTFTLDQKTLDRIDDFRFSVKSKNQTQAILRLLDAGLSAFEEETKQAPAPAEASTGDISLEESNALLVALGYIKPGEQISDDDLAFRIPPTPPNPEHLEPQRF